MKTVSYIKSPGFRPGGLSFSKRPILILILLLALLEMGLYAYKFHFSTPELADTDCYMRLVRVQELYNSGDWHNAAIIRSNAPYGEVLHWTRPMDLLLMAGAYIGAAVVGFSKALFWWGVAIGPVLQLLSIAALAWGAAPLFTQDGVMRLCLLMLGQAGIWQCFMAGRPDHHSLLALLFILLLGCTIRMLSLDQRVYYWAAGLIAAGGIWVSVEFMAPVAMVLATLAVLWLMQGGNWAQNSAEFSLVLALAAALALVIERPMGELLAIEYDKISVVHIAIFAIITIFWTIMKQIVPGASLSRLGVLLGGAAIGAITVKMVFPAFFQGPFAAINPDILPVWLSKVNEVQPLFSPTRLGVANTIMFLGPALLVVPYIFYKLLTNQGRSLGQWVLYAAGVAIFIPLTLYQVRWSSYAELTMVIPLGLLLSSLIQQAAFLHKPIAASAVRVGLTVTFCLVFFLAGMLIAPKDDRAAKSTITKATAFLNEEDGIGASSKTILTDIDFGPEILYRTKHKVIATPYHRNGDGIMFVHNVMTATTDDRVSAMLASRGVDLILIYPQSSERIFYLGPDNSFYQRLLAGQHPAWLKPVKVPPELNGVISLYQVDLKDVR